MTSLTICPHFLTDYNQSSPSDIEINIIKPLLQCFKLAAEHNITIVFSSEILRIHRQNFPWNLISNPAWAGHLSIWNGVITSYLTKVKIIDVDDFTPTEIYKCSHLSTSTAVEFSKFIEIFGKRTMHGGLNEEGIFISDQCGYRTSLTHYFLFSNTDEIAMVKYPWLRVYDRKLPYGGDFPYIPKENWRNFSTPIRSPVPPCGYLDKHGNSWQWDKLHDNHWDVQHPPKKGGYTNVSTDGKIL